MTVQYRNPHTLACDLRKLCFNDLSVLHFSENTKRLLLALLFLSANERDDVSNHFRPVFKCFSGAGDCLVCRNNKLLRSEFLPCCKARSIALDRAVRFYGNKSARCAETFLLIRNHIKMSGIDLRHYHRNIRRPAVRAVV